VGVAHKIEILFSCRYAAIRLFELEGPRQCEKKKRGKKGRKERQFRAEFCHPRNKEKEKRGKKREEGKRRGGPTNTLIHTVKWQPSYHVATRKGGERGLERR